jgi:hypothetical protein
MKHKFLKSVTMAIGLTCLSATNVSAALVASEDFSSGASGWSDNRTTLINGNGVLGGYEMFGEGVSAVKTFALSGEQTFVNIDVSFWKGDSWDDERFYIYIDDNLTFDAYFGASWGTQQAGRTISGWNELVIAISMNYETTATSLKLEFTSNLDSGPNDEWWAIDDLVINDNTVAS